MSSRQECMDERQDDDNSLYVFLLMNMNMNNMTTTTRAGKKKRTGDSFHLSTPPRSSSLPSSLPP